MRSTASDMHRQFLAATTATVAAVTDPGNAFAPLTGANLYPAGTTVVLDPQIRGISAFPPLAVPNPVPAGYQPMPANRPNLRDAIVEDTAASVSDTPPYGLLFTFPTPVTFNAISLWDDPAHPVLPPGIAGNIRLAAIALHLAS